MLNSNVGSIRTERSWASISNQLATQLRRWGIRDYILPIAADARNAGDLQDQLPQVVQRAQRSYETAGQPITGTEDYHLKAATPLRALHELMGRAPAGTGHWLAALDFYVSTPKEVVIIGPRNDPATAALLQTVYGGFHPNKVLVGSDGAGDHGLPLLEDRGMVNGQPTAYVCQNYTCQLPVTTPEELAAQLEG